MHITDSPDVIVDDRAVANADTRGCVFRKLKDDGDGYIQYVQIIKVQDTKRPTVTCPKNDTLCINTGYSGAEQRQIQCVQYHRIQVQISKATDNCVQPNEISFRYEVSTDAGKSWTKSGPKQKRFNSSTLSTGTTCKSDHKTTVVMKIRASLQS